MKRNMSRVQGQDGFALGKKTTGYFDFEIEKRIFWPPAILLTILLVVGIVNRELFMAGAAAALKFTIDYFGWMYLLFIFIFVAFVVILSFSSAGNIRLGGEDAKPVLSYWNWWAIALCAGIGTGIAFWGVAEPLYHYYGPPSLSGASPSTPESALAAMKISFLHWSFHPYCIYAVIGVAIAYSTYNLKQPLRVSSALYPIMGDRVNGLAGDIVNGLCIFATVGCVITSMGFGTMQLAGGLEYLLGIPQSYLVYAVIIGLMTATYTISSYTGLQRGIKFLSSQNAKIFIAFVVFVFVMGPTKYFLNLGVESFGGFLDDFVSMSLWTDTFQKGGGWPGSWTIFYWAWWLSLAPILGVFLAKISYGRTIREFMCVNVMAPAIFGICWFITFGGGAIYMDSVAGADLMGVVNNKGVEFSMYALLERFPLAWVTVPLAFLTICISFVTLADSATSAISEICTKKMDRDEPPATLKIFWGIIMGSMTILFLIISGKTGTKALQTSSIVVGLPIVIIEMLALVSVVYSLYGKKSQKQ
ncbi:BCCT family transporter [Desulforhopalus singaporensis]|uniref:Glycine betaine transporter n=1 Tax=Desulforhopalus singaporensis TaxID=91360 RepID=A0A1H0TFL9_9BACT|nr:BCCT family transporter [Desulforhopalus singaporensis]SDP52799.1 glycine betaine transporter [Desulforhopalus singaporensis]